MTTTPETTPDYRSMGTGLLQLILAEAIRNRIGQVIVAVRAELDERDPDRQGARSA